MSFEASDGPPFVKMNKWSINFTEFIIAFTKINNVVGISNGKTIRRVYVQRLVPSMSAASL